MIDLMSLIAIGWNARMTTRRLAAILAPARADEVIE